MKKAVITGATSMLGAALIQECVRHHVPVLAMVRKNSKHLHRIPASPLVQIVPCELRELQSFPKRAMSYDVFYHFGWEATACQKRNDPKEQEKNILYTVEAVHLAHRLGCTRFVGAGSQAEYGRQEGRIGPDTPVHPETAYGIAKYAAGRLSSLQCEQRGMQHIWGRIFSVYGPHDRPDTMVMYAIRSLLEEQKPSFTKSEQQWDYLYCKDAARAFYLLGFGTKEKKKAIYCIGSGEARPLYEYIQIIHKEIAPGIVPGFGEREYADNQVMHLCADITSLQKDTGFEPAYPFKKGIKETIAWYKQQTAANQLRCL